MSGARKAISFDVYEGKIIDGVYCFPELYQNDKGRQRVWRIFVRLVKQVSDRVYENDWNVLHDVMVVIDPAWIVQSGVHKVPAGTECQYWVETGFVDGKIVRHAPNFSEAKCVGRKNERSILLQGMMDARSDWLKAQKKGYSLSGETRVSLRPWPMLAQVYKKRFNKVNFPVFVQPKLNGVRCLAHKMPEAGFPYDVDLYTRSQTEWKGMPQFRQQLAGIPPNYIVDGEIFGTKARLNEIQGWSSDEKKSMSATLDNTDIRYYIYDVFNPVEGAAWPCATRMTLVNQLLGVDDRGFNGDFKEPPGTKITSYVTNDAAIAAANKDYKHYAARRSEQQTLEHHPFNDMDEWTDIIGEINTLSSKGWKARFTFVEAGWLVRTPTIIVRSKAELMIAYYTLLVSGFEGLMIRTMDGIYSTSTSSNKTRSNDLMKFKPVSDAEFPIIGFTCGAGRDQDALIWKCKAGEREFDVVPKDMSIEMRRSLYNEFKSDITAFNRKYMGVQMLVEYAELSEFGVPLQAKAIGVRDRGL